jgi:hypothetical protein
VSVSREERRERIRVAIMRENKQDTLWRDTALTYAAVYRLVYNKPIDAIHWKDSREDREPLRGVPR